MIDPNALDHTELENLYVGLLIMLRPKYAEAFAEPYLENLWEAYEDGDLDDEPTLDLAIDHAADNAHDKNEAEIRQDVEEMLRWAMKVGAGE